MSGGSYNYISFKLEDAICRADIGDPLRTKFLKFMEAAVPVWHAIEWEDSGDSSYKETHEALRKFFSELPQLLEGEP